MFLNNPATARSVLANNNENAAAARRPKSLGENGAKKTSFDENSVKTPHRNKEASKGGGGATTQRRRRALGDISNRKGGGGGAGGAKGGLVLKQRSSNVAASSSKGRSAQVTFAKTPSAKSAATNKARLGGGSGAKSAAKPKLPIDEEMICSRLSAADLDDEERSPFDLVPEEELFLAERMGAEFLEQDEKEEAERNRLEREREEEEVRESLRALREADERDFLEMVRKEANGERNDEEEWDLLTQKLPWEVDDGVFDPAEERRLSGTDPQSLWGDILSS